MVGSKAWECFFLISVDSHTGARSGEPKFLIAVVDIVSRPKPRVIQVMPVIQYASEKLSWLHSLLWEDPTQL